MKQIQYISIIYFSNYFIITTSEFDKLKTENFAARIAQANLVTMTDSDAKQISLNKNINSN